MTLQIITTKNTGKANAVSAAVGSHDGAVLPAEDHLLYRLEPDDVVPVRRRWAAVIPRPGHLQHYSRRSDDTPGGGFTRVPPLTERITRYMLLFSTYVAEHAGDPAR
jgi:hypothetical protein